MSDCPVFLRRYVIYPCRKSKAHSAQIEAEQEHVAGIFHLWHKRYVECLELFYCFQWQGALYCFVNAGVHMAERIALLCEFALYGAIVCCAEYAHIE